MEKAKVDYLKMELENELKKNWRKFVTTSEILEVVIEIIKKRNFQLNDFDIYVKENEIKILFRGKDFLVFDYSQNPASKIIKIK
jgi:hypothetical protein